MAFNINKSEYVEVIVPGVAGGGNTQTKLMFPDIPQLRNKLITSLESFIDLDIPKTMTNRAVVTTAQHITASLTLYMSDPESKVGQGGGQGDMGEFFHWMPMSRLHYIQSAANVPFSRNPFQLANVSVQWPKCYIQLSAPLANTTDVSFLLNVYYINGKFSRPNYV